MDDALELARAQRDADIARLAAFTDEELDYLARLDEIPDPTSEGVEYDDGPHLTDHEWRYILEVRGG